MAINKITSTDLNKAIPLFFGWKISPYPNEDIRRLVGVFEDSIVLPLLNEIEKILLCLQNIEPNWSEHDLVTASEFAVNSLVKIHPKLNDDTLKCLKWVYSWWWK